MKHPAPLTFEEMCRRKQAREIIDSMLDDGTLIRYGGKVWLTGTFTADQVGGHVTRLRSEGYHKHADAVAAYANSDPS